MKRSLVILFVIASVFGVNGMANASSITFTDTVVFTSTGTDSSEDYVGHGTGDVDYLEGPYIGSNGKTQYDYVGWTHHFDDQLGATYASIDSAVLSVTIFDNELDTSPEMLEIALGWSDSGEWVLGEVDSGAYAFNLNVDYLADGEATFYLVSLYGDFYVKTSDLTITYSAVPEPSSVLLMGIGLVLVSSILYCKKRLHRG